MIDISVWGGADAVTIDAVVDRVRATAAAGLASIWFPQTAGLDTLTALAALLGPDRHADLVGQHLVARMTISVPGPPPGLVLAALGPRMLDLAGTFSDGTVTWMTGPKTLEASIVPRIRQAAASAGRPAPRVIVGLPVCLTDAPDEARARLAPSMAGAATMPSYRRMLAAEGAGDPTEIAIVGDEAA